MVFSPYMDIFIVMLLIGNMALLGLLVYFARLLLHNPLPGDEPAHDAAPSDSSADGWICPPGVLKPLGNTDEREYQLERRRISEGRWQAYT